MKASGFGHVARSRENAAFSCLRFIRGWAQPSFQALALSIQEVSCVTGTGSRCDVNYSGKSSITRPRRLESRLR